MSIQSELTRLTNAKAAIQTAIEGKGVTVPSGTLLDGMAALIESIEAGGLPSPFTKISTGTVLFTSLQYMNDITFNHGLGIAPKIFVLYLDMSGTYSGGSLNTLFYVDHKNEHAQYVGASITSKNGYSIIKRTEISADSNTFQYVSSTQYLSSGRTFRWVAIA